MPPSRILLATAILQTALALPHARAADVAPAAQDPRAVERVPGRDEIPVLTFPAAEGWRRVDQHADEHMLSRSFAPDSAAGEPAIDFATVTQMRGIWDADLEKAQHVFGRKLSLDCPDLRARLWFADSSSTRRRLVAWTCPGAEPPFAALQLFVQGRDDLFSIELYSRRGMPGEGQLVRWAEWLKDLRLAERRPGAPVPAGDWER